MRGVDADLLAELSTCRLFTQNPAKAKVNRDFSAVKTCAIGILGMHHYLVLQFNRVKETIQLVL